MNGALNALIFNDHIYIAGARCLAARYRYAGDPAARALEYAKANKIKVKSVNLILKTFDCALRFEKLPDIGDRDLRGLIENNINEYFPSPLDGYAVSYRRWPDGDGYSVCLAAAPDSLSKPFIKAFGRHKIHINTIDIFQNAAADFIKRENAYVIALQKDDRINATFVRNGRPEAARDIHAAGEMAVFARMNGAEASELTVYAAECEMESVSEFIPGSDIARIDCAALAAAYA